LSSRRERHQSFASRTSVATALNIHVVVRQLRRNSQRKMRYPRKTRSNMELKSYTTDVNTVNELES
jgi:hypothetical protein